MKSKLRKKVCYRRKLAKELLARKKFVIRFYKGKRRIKFERPRVHFFGDFFICPIGNSQNKKIWTNADNKIDFSKSVIRDLQYYCDKEGLEL